MHTPSSPTVLRVDASARHEGSVTRQLTDALIDALRGRHGRPPLITRDLALCPPPLLDADWIAANTTEPRARTPAQRAALAYSDQLIAELTAADVVILGVPVYNFGVPAALKAWIDLVARARVTFRYSENGPQGLLEGKRAYVVLASGGVAAGGPTDFASGYLRQVLGFLGITDVEVIAADQAMLRSDAVSRARQRIGELLPAA